MQVERLQEVLRDSAARITRVLEALADGEVELAFEIAEDLENDLGCFSREGSPS